MSSAEGPSSTYVTVGKAISDHITTPVTHAISNACFLHKQNIYSCYKWGDYKWCEGFLPIHLCNRSHHL